MNEAPLRVLVGVAQGAPNGIDAYAEHAAVAVHDAGARVTLLTSSRAVRETLAARVSTEIEILDLDLPAATTASKWFTRIAHQQAIDRVGRRVAPRLDGRRFDVAHLNHPALAAWMRPVAERVTAAAWFYPHTPVGRLRETWRHTRGGGLRRLMLTGKSVLYYLGDERGYDELDIAFAPTQVLVDQLRSQGVTAEVCPPPVHVAPAPPREVIDDDEVQLLVVSGDLGHPRKNLRAAAAAAGELSRRGRRVCLNAIGGKPELLEAAFREHGGEARIELHGRKTPAEVHAAMGAADVFVFPSLYEEWGYVAVEAMLCGTPVATLPVYPFPWMLGEGLGFVAEAETPAALADAIERALAGAPPNLIAEAARKFGARAVGERLCAHWRDG